MSLSVESANNRMISKLHGTQLLLDKLKNIIDSCKNITTQKATSTENTINEQQQSMKKPEVKRGRKSTKNTPKIEMSNTTITNLENIFINLIIDDFQQLSAEYNFAVVGVLTKYYQEPAEELAHTNEYIRIMNSENFMSRINGYLDKCKSTIDQLRPCIPEETLEDLVRENIRLHEIEVPLEVKCIDYEFCEDCKVKCIVKATQSELECPNCGICKALQGLIFTDDQFFNQEGSRSKHGNYSSSRHLSFWLSRLLTTSSKTFDQETIDSITYVIQRDSIPLANVDCTMMRSILKELKMTEYNDHVPLLVKLVTGKSPPSLSQNILRMFSVKFNRIMYFYQLINKTQKKARNQEYEPSGKSSNRPYYPYFILKLCDDIHESTGDKSVLN